MPAPRKYPAELRERAGRLVFVRRWPASDRPGRGFPARSTDVLVVQTISDQTFDSRADAITDVLWDHWMGEPEEPSVEQVRKFVVGIGRELAQAADEEPPEAS